MAGKNNGSGIDYYELRRKHEEYLMAKRAQEEASQEEAAPAVEHTQPTEPVAEAVSVPEPAAPVKEPDKPDKPEAAPEETGAYDTAAEAADEAGRDEGYDDYDDEDEVSGGLFDPVLKVMKSAYHGIAGVISKKHARSDDVLDDSDDSYSEEDFSDFEPGENQEKRGLLKLFHRHRAEEDFDADTDGSEADEEDAGNGFDASDDADVAETYAGEAADTADDAAAENFEAEDAPGGDIEDEDEPAADIEDIEDIEDIAEAPVADVEEAPEAPAYDADDIAEAETAPADELPEDDAPYANEDWSGDYDDDEYDTSDEPDGDYDGGETEDKRSFGKRVMDLFIRIERDDVYDEDDYEVNAPDEDEDGYPGYDDSLFVNDHRPYHGEEENIYMEDQTRKTPDLTELMSDGMDEKILSRRERRELRMKQEAAAAESAESAPETPAAPELSADSIVPDEPTREYQIVTRVNKEEPAAEPLSDDALFMDEDDAEEEAAVEEKPARTGLFGRSRKAVEDDYDDDDDGYDDEDDEEDEEPVKPRRARGRKARKYEDDYEDDYDEDEDYDDEDYEDEPRSRVKKSRKYEEDYDDYDDDDYYDDYDDDDGAPGAGHYVLGFIKLIVALALILVVVVFGMYFADQAIEGGFAPYRFIAEKVPFIGEYLPAAEQAPELADPATLTGNDDGMNGGADVAATGEPEVSSEPETVTGDAPAGVKPPMKLSLKA